MSSDVYVNFGADTGELEAGIAIAKAQAKGLGAEVRALAAEMARTGASADSELGQKLNATAREMAAAKERIREFSAELRSAGESAGAIGGFSQIREVLEGLTSPLMAVRNNLGELAEVFAGAFAVEQVHKFAEDMAKLGLETEKASAILGASPESIAQLSLTAEASGTSLQSLEMQFARLSRNIMEDSPQVDRALRTIGVSIADLKGKSSVEQLEIFAEAFSRIADGAVKDAAAMELFGRAGVDMLPMLNEGRGAIEQFAAIAERAGTQLDQGMISKMRAMHLALLEMNEGVKGDWIATFGALNEPLRESVGLMSDLEEETSRSIKSGGDWAQILHGIAQSVQVVDSAFVLLNLTMVELNDVGGSSLNWVNDYLYGLASTAHKVMIDAGLLGPATDEELKRHGKFDFSDIAQSSADATAKVGSDWAGTMDRLVEDGKEATRKLNESWFNIKPPEALKSPKAFADFAPELSQAQKLRQEIERITQAIEDAKLAAAGGIDVGALAGGAGQTPVTPGPGAFSMQKMSEFAQRAGFQGNSLATMVAIAQAESSGLAGAKNVNKDGTIDYGLTQINSSHDAELPGGAIGALDPQMAFNDAFQLSKGGTNFQPWVTYQTGAYARYMDQAKSASGAAGGADIAAMNDQLTQAKTKLFELQQAQGGGSNADKAKLEIAEAEAKQNQNAVAVAEKEAAAKQKDVEAAKAAGIEQSKINQLEEQHAALAVKVREAKDAQAESAARLGIAQAKVTGDVKSTYDAEMNLAKVKLQAAGADPTKQNEARAQMLAAQETYNNAVRQQAMETSRGEIEAAQQAAAAERETLNERLKTHQLNNQQWLTATKQALEQEASAIRAAYAEELAADNQTSAQKIKIAQEEQKRLAEIAKEELKAQDQSAESTQKEWDSVAKSIMGSFNSALQGMISGHESFRATMEKLGESLGMTLIEGIEKTQIEPQLATLLSKLFGPLGSLLGLAPLVAADIGMWEVPQNQVALIHKGELVMPPSEAGAFRSMLSGQAQSPGLAAAGGTHVGGDIHAHFHVPSMDSGDVKRFFSNHSRSIMAALNSGVRNGDHVGLRNLGALR